MATSLEIRTTQKGILYDMIKAKEENKSIDFLIEKMEASMEAEDFAYVKEVINKNKKLFS